jgi:hypothetical protein
MDHYRRLGFAVHADSEGGYGFASREGIEIHLGVVPDDDGRTVWFAISVSADSQADE